MRGIRFAIHGVALIAAMSATPVRWQAQYTQLYSEPTGEAPLLLGPGLQLQSGASVITDPTLVLPGSASVRLKGYAAIATNPAVIPLSGNTTYLVEFNYRILSYGTSDLVLGVGLSPPGDNNPQHFIPASNMFKSAPRSGTFSGGALTSTAGSYVFNISANSADSDVVINEIKIFRQDTAKTTTQPPAWAGLENLPFPRLGKYYIGGTFWPRKGMLPYQYSVDQVESRLAFYDVIAGMVIDAQTSDPASIRRLRQLNPNIVILPYRMSGEQDAAPPPQYGDISLLYSIFQGIPDEWYVKETTGNYAVEDQYPVLKFLNIYPFCPVIGGQTYLSYLQSWLNGKIFPSGVWDGIFFDNLFAEANIHIRNLSNPASLDFDLNRNGIRDETPASISDMTRSSVVGMLQQLRAANGDLQLVMGNAGALPEVSLAPYVNGYTLECASDFFWSQSQPSPAGWRGVFETYRAMQASARRPRTVVMEACGDPSRREDGSYLLPTADDFRTHRLAFGTTLLSDGFYSFDLHDNTTVPLWYDEYSVDAQGNAVEDRNKKGYLGAALTDGVELTDGGTVIFQETFGGPTLPSSLRASPASAVTVSNGRLILANADHTRNTATLLTTNPAVLQLSAGSSYLLTFDATILETLDQGLRFQVSGSNYLDGFGVPWTVAGDTGTIHFPFVLSAADQWSIRVTMSGGGKVAISNLRITKDGVGPWRRDFENGFVLVNPLPQARTFSAAELAGALHRTGIHRIRGTQAPDINNGQVISAGLTVGAFDAIILLADPIRWKPPIVTGVSNAAGGQPVAASRAFVSIYGSNFTPLAYDDWSKSIANGRLPAQLDGVSVTIGGKPAYVYAVTPGQINVQAPDLDNGPVDVVVTTAGGSSVPFRVPGQLYSPAFFPLPGNQPVATHADYTIAAKGGTFPGVWTVAAKPGEIIILWGTGFGPTSPIVPAGQIPAVQAPPTQATVSATLGGNPISVLAAVLSSYPATYQVAIQIPASLSDGDYAIVATVGGVQSPANVTLGVRQ
jgi:uncharacterized protein (TIGR03437 family)